MQKKDKLGAKSLLSADWEALYKKLTVVEDKILKLEKEMEYLRAQSGQQTTPLQKSIPSVRVPLRSQPLDSLSGKAVKAMLKKYDFYCAENDEWGIGWSNAKGKGIANQFERRKKVVFDAATGLTWQQSGSANSMDFTAAERYVHGLNYKDFAGYDDWRLPTLEEAMSLMEREMKHDGLYINPIFDNIEGDIWTADEESASNQWQVFFYYGFCSSSSTDSYVRAVRGGQSII